MATESSFLEVLQWGHFTGETVVAGIVFAVSE